MLQVESEAEEQKKKVLAIEASLQKSGLDRSKAQAVLQAWQELAGNDGKEVTAEDLRKVRWWALVCEGCMCMRAGMRTVWLTWSRRPPPPTTVTPLAEAPPPAKICRCW